MAKKKVVKKTVVKKTARRRAIKVTESTVVNQPGHPVAASCTIMHCQFFDQEQRIRLLEQEIVEASQSQARLSHLLSNAAIAVNGPEPPLTMWSFHDVPEKIDALQAVLASALAEVQNLTGKMHFVLGWLDRQGLLEEHVFSFPDGDLWEPKREDAP